MFRTSALALTSSALVLGAGLHVPGSAEACGGFFCDTVPVVQAEEAIIFDVDLPNNTVTAIINIVYQGSADEFVWVLPLQTAPETISTGSQQAFTTLQQTTTPRFQFTEVEDVGACSEPDEFLAFASNSDTAGGRGAPESAEDPGVQVISRKEVGPYATVVLEGTPEGVRTWLVNNGFLVTDAMMQLVTPYLAKGDTLLALKLLSDRDVGEIRPIEVTMSANASEKTLEACVPIRLTAIAANTDMPITTYVFTDAGRAIPQNFFHAVPNLLKIDWLNRGSNYRQLIADAVDEADGGHAFVTEYAGSPSFLAGTIYTEGQFDFARLRAQTDLGRLLDELARQGLRFRSEVQTILQNRFEAVADCPNCNSTQFLGKTIDPNPALDEIEADVVEPDRRAQAIFDRRAHFTRLLTMLDPEEMTVDPVFTYDATLPEVSNQHDAKLIRYCGMGGTPGSAGLAVELKDGRRVYFDGSGQPNREFIDAMPNALRIEQLAEGILVKDNSGAIGDLLDGHNDRNGAGCDCGSAPAKRSTAGGLFGVALLGLVLLLRRRTR